MVMCCVERQLEPDVGRCMLDAELERCDFVPDSVAACECAERINIIVILLGAVRLRETTHMPVSIDRKCFKTWVLEFWRIKCSLRKR
jgi:hypothetical protein